MRIGLVFGHVATNLGDLAINVGVAEILSKTYPGARLTVALLKPNIDLLQEAKHCFKSFDQVDFEFYGEESISHKLFEVDQMQQLVENPEVFFSGKTLIDCDVIFFNSGEHVFHYSTADVNVDLLWRLTFLVTLSRLGKKTLCLPSTLGPFEGSVGAKVKQVFNQSLGAVLIRDKATWEDEVKGSEWLERSMLSLDPAFYMPVEKGRSQPEGRVLGLVPRLEKFGLRAGARKSSEYSRVQALSQFKNSPSYQSCCQIIEQAMTDGYSHVRVFVQTLADKKLALQLAEDFSIVEINYPKHLTEYFSALAECQAVVAMRFHACIFCMLLDLPVFGVYFKEHGNKIPGLFDMLNSADYIDGRTLGGESNLNRFISSRQKQQQTLVGREALLNQMRSDGLQLLKSTVEKLLGQEAPVSEQRYLLKHAYGKVLSELTQKLTKSVTETRELLNVVQSKNILSDQEKTKALWLLSEKSCHELLGDKYYEQQQFAHLQNDLQSLISEKSLQGQVLKEQLEQAHLIRGTLEKDIQLLTQKHKTDSQESHNQFIEIQADFQQAMQESCLLKDELEVSKKTHRQFVADTADRERLNAVRAEELNGTVEERNKTIEELNGTVEELNSTVAVLQLEEAVHLDAQLSAGQQAIDQQKRVAELEEQSSLLARKVTYFEAKANSEKRRLKTFKKSRRFRLANNMANALNSKYGIFALAAYCLKLVWRRLSYKLRPKTYFVQGLKKKIISFKRNLIARKNKVIRSRINQAISLFDELKVEKAHALAEQTFKERASKRGLLLLIEIAYFRADFKQGYELRQKYLDLFGEPSWNNKVMFNDILYYHKMITEVESWNSLPSVIDKNKVPNGSMYVLHSCSPYLSGGYAQRGHGLIKGMQKNGWKVTPVTRPGFPSDVKKVYREMDLPQSEVIDGVTYQKLDQDLRRGRCEAEYMYQSISHYEEAIDQLGSAVVQGRSTYLIALPALIASVRKGIPFVYEMSGLWEITFESRMQEPNPKELGRINRIKYLEALIASKAQQVFTLTQAMKDEIASRGVDVDKILLCPNSVDPEHFSSFQEETENQIKEKNKQVTIGYVGSFVDYEGLDYLLQAAELLKKEGLDFKLLMVGDGAEFDGLVKLADTLELGDSVEFTGRVSQAEVVEYYKTIDICPFPRKGWRVCEMVSPLKPFEALAMGKPIVVSSVGALSEFIQPGENGLVFEKDNVESLYLNLKALIEDQDTRERIGHNARHWVETERNWVNTSKVITDTYDRLLSHEQSGVNA